MLMLRPLAAVQYIHHRETKSGVAGQLIQGQGTEYANIIVQYFWILILLDIYQGYLHTYLAAGIAVFRTSQVVSIAASYTSQIDGIAVFCTSRERYLLLEHYVDVVINFLTRSVQCTVYIY
jgi:hypothetical protein